MICIILLGGALIKAKDHWRTANFGEGDKYGVTGDRLRIDAAVELYKKFTNEGRDVFFLVSGGTGQLTGTGAPTVAEVVKKELIGGGIPQYNVFEENISSNTLEQLHQCAEIIEHRTYNETLVLSSRYHLPRVEAFIATDRYLSQIYKNTKLVSAEDVLLAVHPHKWTNIIKRAYKSIAMREKIALENAGVEQIKNRTYHYKKEYSGKITVAIVGLGKISWLYEEDPLVVKRMDYPTHFSVLRSHPKFQLIAVQDIDAEARRKFKNFSKKFVSDLVIYVDWEEMIRKERPDLLVVASNTETHAKICGRAIDLGIKNILCEKPLSHSLKDAERVVKKAEARGVNIFVNYLRAFMPSYQSIIAKIKSGYLGRIQSLDIKYSKGIFNNGTHFIDLLRRMFGEPVDVKGFSNPIANRGGKDPTISAVIQFGSGLCGYLHALNNYFYGISEWDILGEKGRIKITNDRFEFFTIKKTGLVAGQNALFSSKIISVGIIEGLLPVYKNIYDCISAHDFNKNTCSARNALETFKIADEIVKSANKK